VLLPLNKRSRFPSGWARILQAGGKEFYDPAPPGLPSVTVQGGVLVARTGGDAARLGADSDGQWIAYARGRLLFVKYYLYSPAADYPGGASVQVYSDRRVTELNPFSPQTALAPGQSFIFPEKWLLLPLDKEVATVEQAAKLVHKIPPPPFPR